MSLATVSAFARRWALLLVLGPVVAGVVGYLVVRQIPPVYQATATILVGQGSVMDSGGASALQGAAQLARTYVEVVGTRTVLEEAARRAGIGLPYEELTQWVDSTVVPNTQLLRITAEDTDPATAAAFVNAIATVFMEQNQAAQQKQFASSRENLTRLINTSRADLDSRTQRLAQLRAAPLTGESQAEINRLQDEITQLQATYSASMRSLEDVRLAEARGVSTMTVVDPAAPPVKPTRPQPLLTTALAVLAGLLSAIGFGAAAQALDDRLQDGERVRAATGLATLGLIPRRPAEPHAGDAALRRLAESYRLLFSYLQVASPEREIDTLLIASPAIGEGKSTTAASLAIVLAEAGRRVLLVDADLHRPTQMQTFRLSNRLGLSSVLLDRHLQASAAIQATHLPLLSVLTSGPAPADASALFASTRFPERLAELREMCDVLVFDSPPVLAQPDAALIGAHVDAVLLVADVSRSRGRDAARAVAMLRAAGANVVGAVLNRAPATSLEYESYTPSSAGSSIGDSRIEGKLPVASRSRKPA